MPTPVLPAAKRYELAQAAVAGGHLAVGTWRPTTAAAEDPGLPVLAIHGITGNHRCWHYLADCVPDRQVIAPDLRGRGGSYALPGPYGLGGHAEDMVAVLDAFGIDRVRVVGHSMGAFVATVLAYRYPDRVDSLILVDGGMPMTTSRPLADEELARDIPENLAARLDLRFRTKDDAVMFWRMHPAFAHDWSPVVADYARYDLGGRAPRWRSRAVKDALIEDSADILRGSEHRDALDHLAHQAQWLTASLGLLGQAPGLYPPPLLLHWVETYPEVIVRPVAGVNHYTIVMSRRGGEAVAAAVHAADDPVALASGVAPQA
ncbi:alpha/beta fold hydrolase [Janibacter sp. GXQ6167]|uniref:alpha/beta fold hydrolase n=1 Tax=Janibacter sp. GXQ6167 TaxID=3240791 RepID=UPI003525591E